MLGGLFEITRVDDELVEIKDGNRREWLSCWLEQHIAHLVDCRDWHRLTQDESVGAEPSRKQIQEQG